MSVLVNLLEIGASAKGQNYAPIEAQRLWKRALKITLGRQLLRLFNNLHDKALIQFVVRWKRLPVFGRIFEYLL